MKELVPAPSLTAAVLGALADGIIPPDARDAGAGCVNAGIRLGEKIQAGTNQGLYLRGIAAAEGIAREKFARGVTELLAAERHELLAVLREREPAFFKQLRMDVSALYLGDPTVWKEIGFPGPSIVSGGYPDFNQPQMRTMNELKEPTRMAGTDVFSRINSVRND